MDTTTQSQLITMLNDLPPENLKLVEEFVRFLRQRAQEEYPEEAEEESKKPYLYPTVTMPAESMRDLVGIMPPVGGDALPDS